jgi:polyhydroxyalkanoate synthesis repressor PhaR
MMQRGTAVVTARSCVLGYTPEMGESRVIKRYANRKLYDTQRSRYVTLDQIADMIRGGDDVKIVDNNSKEDLTTVTLAQIIFEEEKKQKSFLPLNAMRNIIQSGGERIEELVSQAQKRVSGVFSRKAQNAAGGNGEEPLPEPEETPADVSAAQGGALHEFREWIEGSQQKVAEWQRGIDERLRHLVEGISPFASMQKEVAGFGVRLGELEKKVEQLLAERGAAAPATDDTNGQKSSETASE